MRYYSAENHGHTLGLISHVIDRSQATAYYIEYELEYLIITIIITITSKNG